MRTSANWKSLAEIVGIGAVVISLVFVALQLEQSQDIAIAELRQGRQASTVELDGLIAAHSGIWVRGNAGEELDREDKAIYRRLIESLHWSSWTTWNRAVQFGQDTPLQIAIADFAGFLFENPGALAEWSDYIESREKYRTRLVPDDVYEENRFVILVKEDLSKLAGEIQP